jgi:uncharacterized protein YndB with AHSA1/START domain
MADIVHEFCVNAAADEVFKVIAEPTGLDQWWTRASTGRVAEGAEYQLDFGPQHLWAAVVTRCEPPRRFELELTRAHEDWLGTRVAFALTPEGADTTRVTFRHTGWPEPNEHWRVSSYCWAMYLRIMRRYLEHGEVVPYGTRLRV